MATIDTRKGPDGKVVYRARIRRKGYPTQTELDFSRRRKETGYWNPVKKVRIDISTLS